METTSESGSSYVPSEEEDAGLVVRRPKGEKVRKAAPPSRGGKKRATPARRSSSPEAPSRKRQSARQTPPGARKAAKKGKKQKTQSTTPIPKSEDAVDAIGRVAAAAAELPPESALNFSKMVQTGAFFAGRETEMPPRHGEKAVPEGHPECLTGKTFVISGVLESLTRPEAENLIKRHGGRVTSAVSGKTSFLVVGTDSGGSKIAKAKSVGAPLIDEDGLFYLIRAADVSRYKTAVAEAPESARGLEAMDVDVAPSGPSQSADGSKGQVLWVDKYRPQSLKEMVGNNTLIKNLHDWLQNWHSQLSDQSGTQAVLLAGPPGVGKTTAALLACKELGLSAVEVNASDKRNKADGIGKGGIAGKKANQIRALFQNTRLVGPLQTDKKSTVLIMDEVDGMSASDRGGLAELVQNIKKTKIPIICICNDKYDRKLSTLKNYCIELDFRRPTKIQILKRMKEICSKEGLHFRTESAMEALIEQAHGDLRTLIGGLQAIRASTTAVSYKDIETGNVSIRKDQDTNPFETCRFLLSPESSFKKWDELSNAVFGDSDLIPLLVQENYVNHAPKGTKTQKQRLAKLARAAKMMSFGENLMSEVRSRQKWGLMPAALDMGTLAPAAIMRGPRETFSPQERNFPRFTAFLGNLSTTNKQHRRSQALATRLSWASRYSIESQAAVLDYAPVLRYLLTQPLIADDTDGVTDVFDLMQRYCLDKESYDFVMEVTQFKGSSTANPLAKISTKAKTALTRRVNAANITCPALPCEPGMKRLASPKEESPEPTFNPESSVIQDTVKQEVKEEEDVDAEMDVEKMKKSGYHVQAVGERSSKGSASRGRGRGRSSRGRSGRGRKK